MPRPHKLPQTLTSDEVTALLARPNLAAPTGLRNRAIMELMVRCGFRDGDVCGVNLRDVDWRAKEIRLRPEITKGAREAVVYLDADTLEMLRRWKVVRRQYAAGKPWLFTTLHGGPLHRHYLWEMVKRYGERAGIERPIWPHMLRHTFATDLLDEGFNLVEVQQLMRHSDIRTTRIYLHVRDKALSEKVRRRERPRT